MKKSLIFIVIILVLAGFTWLVLKNLPNNFVANEIKEGMKLGEEDFKLKTSNASITVGGVDDHTFSPKVEILKEDSKAKFAINYTASDLPVTAEDNLIRWKDSDKDVYFKVTKDPSRNIHSERYEFDLSLKVKPANNVFSYNIETSDLDFIYQPVIEKKTIETPTHNGKKTTITYASPIPENIQGSYAVYKKDGKTAKNGDYHTEKAFQIYRPKIVDAKGKWIWGELKIDEEQGKLAITVDPAFLASAAYPVIVDPTIEVNAKSLHAVVTNIGRFRWKMTVEYEIQDDNGTVLGSDVLVTEVNPDETSSHLFGFLQDYLKQRAAVWLLADGNYTLREQSHDRLNSVNFQAQDSGDDVADQHTEARLARKQLMESVKPEDFPKYSMTYDEADLLQRPEQPEYTGTGRNKVPTGNMIRGDETFRVGNETPGAGTEILRPNGVGYQTQCGSHTGAANWTQVDEAVTDESITYVSSPITGTYQTDGYALQDTALSTQTIDSIDVTHRAWADDVSGEHSKAGVRLSATNQMGTERNPTAWPTVTNYTDSGIARPGGSSWAVGDLNDLQFVLSLFGFTDDWGDWASAVTQVYVTVSYTAASPTNTPTPTPTSTPTPSPTPSSTPTPATEILRPNGPGDTTTFGVQFPGSGSHWDKVDEAIADDGTTYVAATGYGNGTSTEYYALQDTALTTEIINSIDVTFRSLRDSDHNAEEFPASVTAGIRLSSLNTFGSSQNPPYNSWGTYTVANLARPGGGSWTVSDLNGLQFALKHTDYDIPDDDLSSRASTTQVYVTVHYTAGGTTPTPTPATYKMNLRGNFNLRGGVKLQ